MNMVKEIIDERTIKDFLLTSLFGESYTSDIKDVFDDCEKKIDIAIARAYLDMNRTLRTKKDQVAWDSLKDRTIGKIRDAIKSINIIDNKDSYDNWHNDLLGAIVNDSEKSNCKDDPEDHRYSFGQAQKWINLTMKYLIVLKYKPINSIINYLHVPIDLKVAEAASSEFETINKDDYLPWSTKVVKGNYKTFQDAIRENHSCPIQWEFKAWNKG